MKIRRSELYDQLWSAPVTKVSQKLQITAAELRKLCIENKIPLPANGHWMKMQFGKEVKIIPLGELLDPNKEIEIIDKSKIKRKEGKQVIPQPLLKTAMYHVPDKLINPDKLIQEAIIEFKERQEYRSDDVLINLFDSIKIKTSKKLFDRALRFMDTMIKIFRARGYSIEVKNRETHVIIRDEKIQINCREKIKRTLVPERNWHRASDTLTGLLTFNIEGFYPKQWIDGKMKLEEQIPLILDKLESEAERLKIWHMEIEENHKMQQNTARMEREKQEIQQKELEDFKTLINKSDRFQRVKQMREYVDAVNTKMKGSNETNEDLKKWIEWATKQIDLYDPLIDYPKINL